MAKHGGYPGGMMPGNMNNLMKQAQRMQQKMQAQQEELEQKEFSASAGGGAVKVTMSGKKELLSVTLAPEVVDPDDIEMLQDLVMTAVNDVINQVESENANSMAKLTGGLGGLF